MAVIEGNYVHFHEHGGSILFHLNQLYTNDMFLDTSIICYGSEIYAHKVILAAASPVLRERLHKFGDCYARIELEAEIQSFHATTDDVKLLIEYIYKGQVQVPQLRVSLFLELGNYFKILGLCKQTSNLGCPMSVLSPPIPNLIQPFPLTSQDTINYEELSNLHGGNDYSTSSSYFSNEKLSESQIKADKSFSASALNPMLSNVSEDNSMTMEVSSFHWISNKSSGNIEKSNYPKLGDELQNFDSISNDHHNFSANSYSNVEFINHDNVSTPSDNAKDIFYNNSTGSSPGASDCDILFTNLSHQPDSYFSSADLDPTDTSTEPCLIDLTFQQCKIPIDVPVCPERQVRLKVKDSIGGVSLQDTSQGEGSSKEQQFVNTGSSVSEVIDSLNEIQEVPVVIPTIIAPNPSVPESTKDIIACLQCSKKFDVTDDLTIHLWEAHSIGTEHKCILCTFKSLMENKLVEHGKTHSEDRQCCVCGKKFKTRITLRNHLLCHTSDKWFKCTECSAHYSQRNNLVKHLASEHRMNMDGQALDQQLVCTDCPFKTFAPHKLNNHKIRCHTENKANKCTLCSYSTTERTSLVKHMRTHTLERPYICDSCGLSFVTVSSLKRHSRSHSKEKPHVCVECGQQYADRKRLRDHYLKHKSLKPFKCDFCSYCCRRRDNLQSHVRRNHSKETQLDNG